MLHTLALFLGVIILKKKNNKAACSKLPLSGESFKTSQLSGVWSRLLSIGMYQRMFTEFEDQRTFFRQIGNETARGPTFGGVGCLGIDAHSVKHVCMI